MNPYKTSKGRLREDGVKEILLLRTSHMSYKEIALKIGVSPLTVFNVCHGRTHIWAHEDDNDCA